jgi:hypothetical protein
VGSVLVHDRDEAILRTTRASEELTAVLVSWASEERDRVRSLLATERVAAADAMFESLWAILIDAGMMKNNRSQGMLAFVQALEGLTHSMAIDAAWAEIHKGAHYYNMGLVYFAASEVDRAFKYFQMADEEDAAHKSTAPGDLFRTKRIFLGLRERFYRGWMEATKVSFHDGLSVDDRIDVITTAVAVLPDRYLLARCQVGVMRACVLERLSTSGVRPPFVEHLLCIEDIGLLSEAAAKMLHENTWKTTGHEMLGHMLRKDTKVAKPLPTIGFVSPDPKVEITDEPAFRAMLAKAAAGDRGAIAGVVKEVRNQASHSTPFPDWYLEPSVLRPIILVQLDFITTVLAALLTKVPMPAFPSGSSSAPPPGMAQPSPMAQPSGTSP